jgi:hypothetical protein
MTTKADRLSLFVFIDAFGWELVQHYPFLDDLLPVKAPLGTIFGYSSTCIPTILTGKLPREHGHFAFFTRANGTSPFKYYRAFGLLPKSITGRGRVRSYMSKYLKQVHGITGYFQIYNMPFKHLHHFDYTEKRDIFEPGGINGGCPVIFDYLRENDIPFHRSDCHANEETNLAAAGHAMAEGDIRFAFVYLAAMDSILHCEGKYGDGVARKIRWYDEQLRALMQRAEQRYHEVRLFVFSDHGMTDTIDTCPLMARIDALGLQFGQDYLAAYDSTMARFWFDNPRSRDQITTALNEESHGHTLTQDELTRWGCDFPENKYGDLFFLMNPGQLLCPSFMGEKPLAGMHGYSPEDKDSVAAFMTNAAEVSRPARLDDMRRLMCAESGVKMAASLKGQP